jgi:hypothetical protein
MNSKFLSFQIGAFIILGLWCAYNGFFAGPTPNANNYATGCAVSIVGIYMSVKALRQK